MTGLIRTFYLFSGIHGFLIGLLPIFIPVILWNKGLNLADIANFTALTALGFVMAMLAWDRLRATAKWSLIIALSFLFEIALVSLLLADNLPLLLSLGALINGAAGCFYWSTQRILFQRVTETKNSGNTFGNFQILLVIVLKLGVLIGSYLLDAAHLKILLALYVSLSMLGYFMVKGSLASAVELLEKDQPKAFSFVQIMQFQDAFKSKTIFLIDGVFLFLESYFWLLSLYLLTQQNLLKLGLLIVILGLCLAVIFFIIKKRIDHSNAQRIFIVAVFAYALSWLLRGQLSLQGDTLYLYVTILIIAFLTSFFRLAFNKRFYDLAERQQAIRYIICKSYYSQFVLVLFFTLAGYLFSSTVDALQQLQNLYLLLIPLVFIYLFYGDKNTTKPAD